MRSLREATRVLLCSTGPPVPGNTRTLVTVLEGVVQSTMPTRTDTCQPYTFREQHLHDLRVAVLCSDVDRVTCQRAM